MTEKTIVPTGPGLTLDALTESAGREALRRADLLASWLASSAGRSVAQVIPGLRTRQRSEIQLDEAGVKARGWNDGLAGYRRIHQGDALVIGRYDEERAIYFGPAFEGANGREPRKLHIGIDIYCDAGTEVIAPIDGHVHSFRNNAAPKDYGPTIILAHGISAELEIYSLYGHLSRDSLVPLRPGDVITAGTPFARLGRPDENGDWPPHLHFQFIADLLGQSGDFPGAARSSERGFWTRLCPDPRLFLGL